MTFKRCLVIGSSGQLGCASLKEFGQQYEIFPAVRSPGTGELRIDLSDSKATVRALEKVNPDCIIIAGAYCNVDLAESEQALCFAVNVEGPLAVAEYARARNATLVYYSTDSVFDGTKTEYTESDSVNPLNVYAQSKVEGENAIRRSLPEQHLIIRTAWLYGPDEKRRNFIYCLLDELRSGRKVRVPLDQWGCPTFTEDLARATRVLLENGARGTFHAVGSEYVNRVFIARAVCKHFGLDETQLVPTPTEGLGRTARRPLRVRLSCQRLLAYDGIRFQTLEEGLMCLQASMNL